MWPDLENFLHQPIRLFWRITIHCIFHVKPNVFNDVEVWTLCRPRQDQDALLLEVIFGKICSMARSVVLLKYKRRSSIPIDYFCTLQKILLQDFGIIFCIHRPLTNGQLPDAIRPNAPLYHHRHWIGKCGLKKLWIICFIWCSPYPEYAWVIL